MARSTQKFNKMYTWPFFIPNSLGTGGFTGANSIAKFLYKDFTLITSITVVVSELDASNSPGWYTASYTPESAAVWFCRVSEPTYNPTGWGDDLQTYTGDIDAIFTQAISNFEATAGTKSLYAALAMLVNKCSITSPTLTVFKDDGSTAFETYTLTYDANQTPIKASNPA